MSGASLRPLERVLLSRSPYLADLSRLLDHLLPRWAVDTQLPGPKRVGGRLSLDFLNTVDLHSPAMPGEQLSSCRELVEWASDSGYLDPGPAESLVSASVIRADAADAVLGRALRFLEALYRVLTSMGDKSPVRDADLRAVNREVALAGAHQRLAREGEGFRLGLPTDGTDLSSVLWPIAADAADLLSSDELGRVRGCSADDCDYVFLDTSRNHSRRWCSMDDCGNRFKARRHYARVRAKSPSGLTRSWGR